MILLADSESPDQTARMHRIFVSAYLETFKGTPCTVSAKTSSSKYQIMGYSN